MRPSDQVLVAGLRWVDLLRRNTLAQAWILIGTYPHYSDLSRSQYHAGIEWLLERGLVVESATSLELASIFHWAGLGRCDGLRIAVLV